MAKTHYSWRTRKVQTFQSFGCGQTHEIIFVGNCEVCGRSVYGVNSPFCSCDDKPGDDPDPRGAIPPAHCVNRYHAKEYGLVGRDIMTCYDCAQTGTVYRQLMDAAKANGTWRTAEEFRTNTPWHVVDISAEVAVYLRGTHKIWSRLFDGEHVFTVRPLNETPGANDGGYASIAAALKVKGMDTKGGAQ